MNTPIKEKLKIFKERNNDSSFSIELKQVDDKSSVIVIKIFVSNKIVSNFSYTLSTFELLDNFDELISNMMSNALDLANNSNSALQNAENENNFEDYENEDDEDEEDGIDNTSQTKNTADEILEKLRKLKELQNANAQQSSEQQTSLNDAVDSLYDDSDVEDQNDIDTNEDDELASSNVQNMQKKEIVSSDEIISSLNDDLSSNVFTTRFDKDNLIDSLSGDIKEAYSYVTNYRNYKGMTLAQVDEKNPMIIKWFAIPQKKKEQLYPNETKYCKIIVEWKEKLGIK